MSQTVDLRTKLVTSIREKCALLGVDQEIVTENMEKEYDGLLENITDNFDTTSKEETINVLLETALINFCFYDKIRAQRKKIAELS